MSRYHIFPENDLRDHVREGDDCWCEPHLYEEGDDDFIVHNALDQRDKYETGELRAH